VKIVDQIFKVGWQVQRQPHDPHPCRSDSLWHRSWMQSGDTNISRVH